MNIGSIKSKLLKTPMGLITKVIGPNKLADYSLEKLVISRFMNSEVGKAYGLSRDDKIELVKKIKLAGTEIVSGTSWISHVVLAEAILRIPKILKGDVIECGSFKGASSASLSLICKAVNRKLIIADSFEGLPDDGKNNHIYPHLQMVGEYQAGMYKGVLGEVKNNISKYGVLAVCEFVKGFYSNSLPGFKGKIAFAFFDVDLASSMRECIEYIWPKINNRGFVYTDDSCDMEVVKIWFDEQWWRKTLNTNAPGYVGSDCGLPINPDFSALGYTQKTENSNKVYKKMTLNYGSHIIKEEIA